MYSRSVLRVSFHPSKWKAQNPESRRQQKSGGGSYAHGCPVALIEARVHSGVRLLSATPHRSPNRAALFRDRIIQLSAGLRETRESIILDPVKFCNRV